QLHVVERLAQVVVGPRGQAAHDVLALVLSGEEDDVDARLSRGLAHALADLHPVRPRHHPVQERDARRVGALEDAPGRVAVLREHDLVAPLREDLLQEDPDHARILGEQDSHGPRYLTVEGTRVMRSRSMSSWTGSSPSQIPKTAAAKF